MATETIRINHQIKSPELRVLGSKGENYGIISLKDALNKAEEAGLDLIEISAKAIPPVAKIMDYGKFQYDENKKLKSSKSRGHASEIKNIQVKIGTSEHDLELKAKKTSAWLQEGHKIKIDLFLTGRSRFLDFNFLKERLERILKLITVEFRAEEPKKTPKGLSVMIEKGSKK